MITKKRTLHNRIDLLTFLTLFLGTSNRIKYESSGNDFFKNFAYFNFAVALHLVLFKTINAFATHDSLCQKTAFFDNSNNNKGETDASEYGTFSNTTELNLIVSNDADDQKDTNSLISFNA